MHHPPNEPTLRDFFQWVNAHRLLLVAALILAVAASIVYSATQKPTYIAQASVAFQDPSLDLGLVGLPIAATQTPDQLAATGAQTIVEPGIAATAKSRLKSPLSPKTLLQSVTATAQPTTNLVLVQARAETPAAAQNLANAFANLGAAAANKTARGQYALALLQLERHPPPKNDLTERQLFSEQLSRFQALSTIAQPARVVDPARRPSTPASPRPVRNAVLAALLGLVIGLLAAYVRDSFDRRLRGVTEIAQQFDLPLLGHVRSEALGRSPLVDGDGGVSAIDWELFRILRRNLDFVERGDTLRTIAVTSSLPQEGKSTVATCLAFASAAAGKRTLLLECDLRRPVFATRLDMDAVPGVTDFVTGKAEPQAILRVVRFGDFASSNGTRPALVKAGGDAGVATSEKSSEQFMHEVVCVCAGSGTNHPVELLRSDRFRTMLNGMREAYDLVVIDTPPLLSVADTLELLPNVDAAVLCVRMLSTTRQQANAGIAALRRLPDRPTGLVITGTGQGNEEQYGYYGYYSS